MTLALHADVSDQTPALEREQVGREVRSLPEAPSIGAGRRLHPLAPDETPLRHDRGPMLEEGTGVARPRRSDLEGLIHPDPHPSGRSAIRPRLRAVRSR